MELDIQKLKDGKYHLIGAIKEQTLTDQNKIGWENYQDAKDKIDEFGYTLFNYNPIFKGLFNSLGV